MILRNFKTCTFIILIFFLHLEFNIFWQKYYHRRFPQAIWSRSQGFTYRFQVRKVGLHCLRPSGNIIDGAWLISGKSRTRTLRGKAVMWEDNMSAGMNTVIFVIFLYHLLYFVPVYIIIYIFTIDLIYLWLKLNYILIHNVVNTMMNST